ncbi:MAG: hypothetical protein ACI8RZ_007145, partial [Myxococcota bacterium]
MTRITPLDRSEPARFIPGDHLRSRNQRPTPTATTPAPTPPPVEVPVNAPIKAAPTTAREDILAAIKATPGISPADIAAQLGLGGKNAKTVVCALRKDGLVEPHDNRKLGQCFPVANPVPPKTCPLHSGAHITYSGVCKACMTTMRLSTAVYLDTGHIPKLSTLIAKAFLAADLTDARGKTVKAQKKLQRLLLDASIEQAADNDCDDKPSAATTDTDGDGYTDVDAATIAEATHVDDDCDDDTTGQDCDGIDNDCDDDIFGTLPEDCDDTDPTDNDCDDDIFGTVSDEDHDGYEDDDSGEDGDDFTASSLQATADRLTGVFEGAAPAVLAQFAKDAIDEEIAHRLLLEEERRAASRLRTSILRLRQGAGVLARRFSERKAPLVKAMLDVLDAGLRNPDPELLRWMVGHLANALDAGEAELWTLHRTG